MGRHHAFFLRFSVHGRFHVKPMGCCGIVNGVGNYGCPSRCIVTDNRLSTFSITANNISYNSNIAPIVRTTHVVVGSNTGPGQAVLFYTFTNRRFKLLNSAT